MRTTYFPFQETHITNGTVGKTILASHEEVDQRSQRFLERKEKEDAHINTETPVHLSRKKLVGAIQNGYPNRLYFLQLKIINVGL